MATHLSRTELTASLGPSVTTQGKQIKAIFPTSQIIPFPQSTKLVMRNDKSHSNTGLTCHFSKWSPCVLPARERPNQIPSICIHGEIKLPWIETPVSRDGATWLPYFLRFSLTARGLLRTTTITQLKTKWPRAVTPPATEWPQCRQCLSWLGMHTMSSEGILLHSIPKEEHRQSVFPARLHFTLEPTSRHRYDIRIYEHQAQTPSPVF